jgi:hypothetical protein
MPARGAIVDQVLGISLPLAERLTRLHDLRTALASEEGRLATLLAQIQAVERQAVPHARQPPKPPSLARVLGRVPLAPRPRQRP